MAAYRQAIAIDPDFADAYSNLGIALCHLGRANDAERVLQRAVTLKPACPKCRVNLGVALTAQGKLSDAEAAYRQAIALDPINPEAYSNLGGTLRGLGRLADAEKTLRHAIALRPHFADAFSMLGNTLREQGKPIEAEAAYRRAIALNPDHADAYSNLGTGLEDQGKFIEAEAAYRRAIALKSDFAAAHNSLSAMLKILGRLDEAHNVAEQAVSLAPPNALHFLNLSDVRRFTAGDPYLAAMEDYAEKIATLPIQEQIELNFALAKAYDDVGRYGDSFRYLLAGNGLKRQQIPYHEAATLMAFEHIRAAFTPELMHALRDSGDPSSLPVFVVGMPRSGTTLIEQILGSHPQAFAAGELPSLSHVFACMRPGGNIAASPQAIRHVSRRDLQRLGADYVAEIKRLAPAAARVIDKMPSNFLFIGFIHLALPNARIIHAVRDPVDTCVSCFSKLFVAGQHQTYDLAELGRYYRHYQGLMQFWDRSLPPDRILDVSYEDVVADLEGQARRIVAYCGLEWDPCCLAFHETQRPVRTASAPQVRQPLYRSAIGRAQRYEPFLQPLLAELFGPAATPS